MAQVATALQPQFQTAPSASAPGSPGASSRATNGTNGVNGPLKVTASAGVPEAVLTKAEGKKEEEARVLDAEARDQIPGALPDAPVKLREIPDWFAIGWTGQDKLADPFASAQEIRAQSLLAEFVSESYYGEWWHNAGVIIACIIGSHFLTLFGGGIAGLVVIMAFAATYYTTSIRRTRRNARDDMARELAKTSLKTEVESAAWLNLFMTRFWLIYEPVLSATIVASVDQVLSVSTPAFLDSIRMTTFTLGTKPPRIGELLS